MASKSLAPLAVLIALAAPAAAQVAPADCARAAPNSVDGAVCEHPELAELDRDVAAYTSQVRGALPAEEEQRLAEFHAQFLAQRERACRLPIRQADGEIGRGFFLCLRDHYKQRLVQLAALNDRAKGVGQFVSGRYRYGSRAGGSLHAIEWPDGRLLVLINTLSAVPMTQACNVRLEFPKFQPSLSAATSVPGCRIALNFEPRNVSVTVQSQGCQLHCGVDGSFDGAYRR
jgi:uncharacterized protein